LEATNLQIDRTIFNAIPIPAFVVNGDMQILDLNDAAAHFCGQARSAVVTIRGGEVLGCLHSVDVPGGCGRGDACHSCIIRTSVVSCLKGQAVRRQIVNLQLAHGMVLTDLQVLLTVSPMPDEVEKLALLIVEDITEFSTLKSPLHICMKCKKIWDEKLYWTEVEKFLHEHAGVEFSLGVCPGCARKSESREE
jgi:PAS domain-containing protein